METTIKLYKNNTPFKNRIDDDWIVEFFEYMQGKNPESVSGEPMTLTPEQAYDVIWYLKEHFAILPDNMFKCDCCQGLFNEDKEGLYAENGDELGRYHFCGCCDHLAPYEIDGEY